MENIFSRIRKIIDYNGISNNEFGRNIRCSSAQITQMLTHEKNFGIDKLLKILSAYPNINPDWLLNGNGDMLKSNGTDLQNSSPLQTKQLTDYDCKDNNNNSTLQENTKKNNDDQSVKDLIKALNNLSEAAVINANANLESAKATMKSAEAAIINAEANNRQSKNIEKMLNMLSGEDCFLEKKELYQKI